jgi:purine-binding chemotaxis protein CheW
MEAGSNKYLTLTLGQEWFALDIYSVREILDMTEITRVPHMPRYMPGLVNVRGGAVPVIDLRLKFGMEAAERTVHTRIVILEIPLDNGDHITVGAIADSVRDVLELAQEDMDAPPRMGTRVDTRFLQGIGKNNGHFLLVLDVARVFSTDEVLELEGLGRELAEESATAGGATA